jgi:hypothetical protein
MRIFVARVTGVVGRPTVQADLFSLLDVPFPILLRGYV